MRTLLCWLGFHTWVIGVPRYPHKVCETRCKYCLTYLDIGR